MCQCSTRTNCINHCRLENYRRGSPLFMFTPLQQIGGVLPHIQFMTFSGTSHYLSVGGNVRQIGKKNFPKKTMVMVISCIYAKRTTRIIQEVPGVSSDSKETELHLPKYFIYQLYRYHRIFYFGAQHTNSCNCCTPSVSFMFICSGT